MTNHLVDICEAKIKNGALPNTPHLPTVGGYSEGAICAACEEPILPHSTEIEFEETENATPTKVHPTCFSAWAEALRRSRAESDTQGTAARGRIE